MAMQQLGKMKFKFRDGGLDFRWGDGEARRFGKKSAEPSEEVSDQDVTEEYEDYSEPDTGYNGRFGGLRDESASEDAYADEAYDEPAEDYDDFEETPYDDDPRNDYDDGYDDSQDDDDDGYDDDPRYDYDDGYDDPQDGYDDGYDDEPRDGYDRDYDDSYDDSYDDVSYPEGAWGSVQRYVDENDWVMYLLLVLLPPLGIYLLWRRRRFTDSVRYALTGISAVWFVLLIIWLISSVSTNHDETIKTLPTIAPTATVEAVATEKAATIEPSVTSTIEPAATAIAGNNQGRVDSTVTTTYVWCSATGILYHSSEKCKLITENESVTRSTIENATNRSKYACPVCYGDGTYYYATAGGKNYHTDPKCKGMKDAQFYSKEAAEATGKSPCPDCMSSAVKKETNTGGAVYINSSTNDLSGVKVWCTAGGQNYHMVSDCRNMKGASHIMLRDAILAGKTACATCCATAGLKVYCRADGTYYHSKSDCSGMKNAKAVTLGEALVLGKKQCTTCITTPVVQGTNEAPSEYYVYATKDGKYYHVNDSCSGMTNAVKVTLAQMVSIGRPPCPTCCKGAENTVYVSGGQYYHSFATCSDMTNAQTTTLAKAMAAGYQRCPRCWSNGETNTGGSQQNTGNSSTKNPSMYSATGDTLMVYATQTSKHYHTKSDCMGMKNASRISLNVAVAAGKTACSTCAKTASTLVYSTDTGKHYHSDPNCSDMKNAQRRTIEQALRMGQTACKTCFGTGYAVAPDVTVPPQTNEGTTYSNTFREGTSGINVYAALNEKYFHVTGNCSGKSGLMQVTLERALNAGKKACPTCASSASIKVYATSNGKYYHLSKACAGNGAVSGTLAEAMAYGFKGCPYCAGALAANPQITPMPAIQEIDGPSGVKVYSTVYDGHYHIDKSCAGSGALQVSLETALSYGKTACSKCSAAGNYTVYANIGSPYFHSSKTCAGSGAIAGSYANALTAGLQPCPYCIGGQSAVPAAGPAYAAPASSGVFVDLYSDNFYYHKAKTCQGTGTTNATQVTLQFVKDMGYYRCPYCNPASDIG